LKKTAFLPPMERGGPEYVPGAAYRRPEHVTVCVPRSAAVREDERLLSLTALIAVPVNCRVQLSVDEVRRDVLRQLGIQDQDMGVKHLSTAMFLFHFSTPERRLLLCGSAVSTPAKLPSVFYLGPGKLMLQQTSLCLEQGSV